MMDKLFYCHNFVSNLLTGSSNALSWDDLRTAFDAISEGFPLVIQPISPNAKFARGRKLAADHLPRLVDELGPAPASACSRYGRCNRPGLPFFYAGVGTHLVLSEIEAAVGDTIGLLHLRPKRELNVVRLGAIDLYRRTSGDCHLHETVKKQIEPHVSPLRADVWKSLLDACIADFFSRPGDDEVYKITSAVTSALVDGFPQIDGVLYQSVDHVQGACLALKASAFADLEATEAQMLNITAQLGYGIFDFEEQHFADAFEAKKIKWRTR